MVIQFSSIIVTAGAISRVINGINLTFHGNYSTEESILNDEHSDQVSFVSKKSMMVFDSRNEASYKKSIN